MDFNSIGSALENDKGVPMHVLSPDGHPLWAYEGKKGWDMTTRPEDLPEGTEAHKVELLMAGQDSRPFKSRQREVYEAVTSARKVQKNKKSFDEANTEAMMTIAAGIVGWNYIVWEGGKLMDFTVANVMKWLGHYAPGKEQADEFIVDRSNFFTNA